MKHALGIVLEVSVGFSLSFDRCSGSRLRKYATFVDVLVAKFRPEGKLVMAAVAKYMQNPMRDSALHQFDFINVMNHSSYATAVEALQFYSIEKKVAKRQIVLGFPSLVQISLTRRRRIMRLSLRLIRTPGSSIWWVAEFLMMDGPFDMWARRRWHRRRCLESSTAAS